LTRVVAWSGGPDSTLALVQALESDDPVVAVHVMAAADDIYMRACHEATLRLEPVLAQIRPFPVVRYRLECDGGESETTDEVTALILCAALAYDNPTIYWGRCKEDRKPESWINKSLPKAEIAHRLGELWPLTWSCLYPTPDLNPCGECEKCGERQETTQHTFSAVAQCPLKAEPTESGGMPRISHERHGV